MRTHGFINLNIFGRTQNLAFGRTYTFCNDPTHSFINETPDDVFFCPELELRGNVFVHDTKLGSPLCAGALPV